jgi:phenylpyruvate tautomerase PptA (4-oxalocrotonate tautomerase family)
MTLTKEELKADLAIRVQAIALENEGKHEEAIAILKANFPLEPWAAKIWKEKVGLDFLLHSGWNLSLVEAKYGKEWLKH